MGYILAEILACLILAWLLGVLTGWLLNRGSKDCTKEIETLKDEYEKKLLSKNDECSERLKELENFYEDKIKNEQNIITDLKKQESIDSIDIEKEERKEEIEEKRDILTIKDPNEKCYELDEIEGIGPGFALRLKKRGIFNSCFLANKFLFDDEATKKMASKLDIDYETLKAWASMADLMKVEGISGEFAETLQAIGIKTRQDLMISDPYHLYSKLSSYKREYPNGPDIPDISVIKTWVEKLSR